MVKIVENHRQFLEFSIWISNGLKIIWFGGLLVFGVCFGFFFCFSLWAHARNVEVWAYCVWKCVCAIILKCHFIVWFRIPLICAIKRRTTSFFFFVFSVLFSYNIFYLFSPSLFRSIAFFFLDIIWFSFRRWLSLLRLLRVFDRDGNGYITRDELQIAMEMMQENVTETQVNEMLQLADLDKDGKINYEGNKKKEKLAAQPTQKEITTEFFFSSVWQNSSTKKSKCSFLHIRKSKIKKPKSKSLAIGLCWLFIHFLIFLHSFV